MKRLPAPAHAYPTRQKDHQVTIIPSLSIQNPNIESKKWREIKRSYRGHLGNEEKNYFLSFFPLSVKTLVFPSSSGKTKTKGGAEKSKRRRTVAGKTTSLHRFRRFELDSGVYQIMEERTWLKVAVILCLFAVSNGRELKLKHKDHSLAHYNHTLATILVEYASAVYMSDLTELFTWTCSRCDDMTEGFEIIELVVDIQHCLQAFVGVAQDLNAVIIAFRGTQEHSIQNWVEDLYWKQLDLNYPGMPDAMVHHGFYYAYHNTTIRPGVLNAVKRAREIYGNVPIMVTGHSMGGAMASFCGLDLIVNHEAENVQVMTFGQPRIGNAVFVSYYSELVPNTIRVTNEHDIVPHLPPYYSYFPQKTYHHFPREVWLYNIGLGSLVYTVEKECDGSGEDPTCSRSVAGNSIADHLEYYGVILHSESWNSCRIVMDPLVNEYIATDADGNFRLSKDPAVSVIKMNARSGNGGNSV